MLTANFLETFTREFKSFIHDIKNDFTNILADIHNFLNRFMSDDVLTVFCIAIGAFILILIFRAVINKR